MDTNKFLALLKEKPKSDLLSIQQAYWFSRNVHREQKRTTGEPYFEHPRRVAVILIERGYTTTNHLILALLHDVVEDTCTPPEIIISLFGEDVYEQIKILSKSVPSFNDSSDEIIRWTEKKPEEYYAAIAQAAKETILVKLADRLDNLRTCKDWTPQRIRKYMRETDRFVLPMATPTDEWFKESILDAMNELALFVALK